VGDRSIIDMDTYDMTLFIAIYTFLSTRIERSTTANNTDMRQVFLATDELICGKIAQRATIAAAAGHGVVVGDQHQEQRKGG
jgi:hypothetical protein